MQALHLRRRNPSDHLRLPGLVIDHEDEVNARVLRIPKIDNDDFDDEAT